MGKACNFTDVSGNLRYVIAIIHVCILGLAVVLLTVCHLMQLKEEETIGFLHVEFTGNLGSTVYTCGGFMVFLAILGFYGLAKKYSGGLVVTYSLVAIISGIIGLSSGAIALFDMENPVSIKEKLLVYMDHYDKPHPPYDDSKEIWDDKLHLKFECCGLDDYTDWSLASCCQTTLKVPSTCCKLGPNETSETVDPDCGQNFLPLHENASVFLNSEGCLKPLMRDFNTQLVVLGAMGIAVGTGLVCLAIFSCFLILTKRV